jgi:thioredoxin-related protein
MKKYLSIILIVLLIFSCDENSISSNTYESEANESHTLNLTTQTELVVQNTNGSIIVTGSDTTSNMYCLITKKVISNVSESDAQSHLSEIDITIQDNSDNIKVEVDNPNDDDRDYVITLNIILPHNFKQTLTLGNGNISVKSATKKILQTWEMVISVLILHCRIPVLLK